VSNLFYLPRALSLAGAKLYFYQTGTSTPQTTYQDVDLTTPHSNPVVADSDGYFAPIYLDPSLPNYRVTLRTSADVLIDQRDGVPASDSSGKVLRLVDTAPKVILENTLAATGEGKWKIEAATGALIVKLLSDDELSETSVITIYRVADVLVSSFELYAGAVDRLKINSIPVSPLEAVKTTGTGRSSTTTFANDPDLLLQFVTGGHYRFELFLRVVGNGSSGAGGFKLKMNYSGTTGANGIFLGGQSTINSSDIVLDMTDGTAGHSFASIASSGNGEYIRYIGYGHFSNSGNLSVQWAQNSSNAATTNVMAGSYLVAKRMTSATS
jgi:hypothetical protein